MNETKFCPACKETRDINRFGFHSFTKDRLRVVCNFCYSGDPKLFTPNESQGGLGRRFKGINLVYVIQSPYGGPVKIGFSSDLGSRFLSYETHCPYPLRIVAVKLGDKNLELSIRVGLEDYTLHNEWVFPSQKLQDILCDGTWDIFSPLSLSKDIVIP